MRKIQIIEPLVTASIYIVMYFVFKTIINNFLNIKTPDNEIITIPNSDFFGKLFSVSEKKENRYQQTI